MASLPRNRGRAMSSPSDHLMHADGYYHFDRYIGGRLMAEGVMVSGEGKTFDQVLSTAAKLASRGPRGEPPVLLLKRAGE